MWGLCGFTTSLGLWTQLVMCGESRHGTPVICLGTTGILFLHFMLFFWAQIFYAIAFSVFSLKLVFWMNWVRWVALLAFGEGWHNNHHAFEFSARHGLEWWQIDMTWYAVKFLQAIGLATDVKLPTDTHKQKMAFDNGNVATWKATFHFLKCNFLNTWYSFDAFKK